MNGFQDISKVDKHSYPYIFEQNISINLRHSSGIVRCNVYRPKDESQTYPVLVTYGPYGKDIPYQDFHPKSFSEVNPEHKSAHAAWEVPDPGYWTSHRYAVVRIDERGLGQSPGLLDTMSRGTSEAFFDAIEWAAEQSEWSSGKVGLLGISYYAGSQWRVAALQPKGLAAIIPWEGMSDYYRDRCRHGGILSDNFISFWWNRQVLSNQYGLAGRADRKWGPDTIEGDLDAKTLANNRRDQQVDNAANQYRDQPYYASKEYNLEDIKVPLLSVANWGGILLHLRGNIEGFTHAGSEFKYLRCITGRHDLPFYYKEEVEVQRSFLDAFLKGDDRVGWARKGAVPTVDMVVRKGDVGFNNPEGEKRFERRTESAWPLPQTRYVPFYLTPSKQLTEELPEFTSSTKITYRALGNVNDEELVRFSTKPVNEEIEITGHIVAHLNVSMTPFIGGSQTSDIDLFLTIRHMSAAGKEVLYTGTAGDGVPLCKGWLRVSNRRINSDHPRHRPWLPYRDYFSTSVLPVLPGEVYPVDVEIWPTNVVLEPGAKLIFELSSGDTAGCDRFQHISPTDRSESKFAGNNHIHFGPKYLNYVTLPIIPKRN
ncbi:X-Pro dipeptidyl-peptidase protein [Myriangium duriaei CBS 260.36]|uniref:X-Pro dipeptidyl-peptidase protein n=1 Tax=Myriangium duriaei CBS 260.36 TaxID=1168546 RepID=A0A9P4JCT1_9PEZI|nr:X-Pro dipeptidyl-peptidase protein [Myriangium duriaei CBS 260.36]